MPPQKIAAILLLIGLMLHTGLQVDRERLFAVLKDYGLLARAFLANFIIVPVAAVLVVRGLHLEAAIATGVLLMAIAPGVPFVVVSGGRRKGGSLGFALSLAFLLPLVSVVTVPITARLVLPLSGPISEKALLISLLVFQLVPLLIGIAISDRAPRVAERLSRPLVVMMLAVLAVLLGLMAVKIVTSIGSVYGSRGMFAMLAIVVVSVVTGWLLGGRKREFRRTLSIGTALRNIGLAATVATAFRIDLVLASVLTYLVVQFLVVLLLGTYYTRTAGAAPAQASP